MRPPACTPQPEVSGRLPLRPAGPAPRPHRLGLRLVLILLSHHGLSAATIAGLLGCDPATVRRWIHRYNTHGPDGLADRPRAGRLAGVATGLASCSAGCSPSPRPGRSLGYGSGWADPPSANAPCAGGSARSPAGGGPGWSPRATPTVTRSWPSCATPSPNFP